MGEFSPEWLSMREPFDHAARSESLLEILLPHLSGPLRIVDLACGHGSSLRYLAPRLPGPQHWTMLDVDPDLLAALAARPVPDGVTVTRRVVDLRTALAALPLMGNLVVTSALLDLVSADFLATLARRCSEGGLPLLAALTVDGRVEWQAADPLDSDVMRWFRAHQHTDRGFGPSPGVGATDAIAGMLEAGGMTVHTAAADWEISAAHPDMLAEMVRGVATASAEMSPRPDAVAAWRDRRLAQAAAGTLSLRVGHRDLLALPG